ncbi:MAG: DUF4411 family protein [Oscillospiraceae bacterium]|nr:DUF4411 family protein [Oscillospiraceae bacterium]
MSMNKGIFLLDANAFIEPYKKFYTFTIAPGFWDFLKNEIETGKVALLDVVAKEISKGKDDLAAWMDTHTATVIDRRSPDILASYGKILTHIQTSGNYTERALTTWAGDIADPWIIATALARKYTIVTFEQPNSSLGTSLTSRPKIPDVCRTFGVDYVNLYQFMNIRHFSF